MSRLIDADMFEHEMNHELRPLLVKKYGEEEAERGLHFSLRDVIMNVATQPTVNAITAERLRAEFPEPTDWTDIEQTVFSIREIWEIIDRLEEEENEHSGKHN